MVHYLYLMSNPDYDHESKIKYGYTTNPRQRIEHSHAHHSHRSKYVAIYEIEQTDRYRLEYCEFDKIFSIGVRGGQIAASRETCEQLARLRPFLIDDGGGIEFLHFDGVALMQDLITHVFPAIGLIVVRMLDIDEFAKPVEPAKINGSLISSKTIIVRNYQVEIITHVVNELKRVGRIYLELATGGGKSFIAFASFARMDIDLLIILSPRKIVNEQNESAKYVGMLGDGVEVVTCCTQSADRIYEMMRGENGKRVAIWFDEAHWSIEGWANASDEVRDFLLMSSAVKYRLFASASPNRLTVLRNREIFGNLYRPISARQLIELGYLCAVRPYIFSVNVAAANMLAFILDTFGDKCHGFSFHNNQVNARKLFNLHVEGFREWRNGYYAIFAYFRISGRCERI
jgi:hypothetical protein